MSTRHMRDPQTRLAALLLVAASACGSKTPRDLHSPAAAAEAPSAAVESARPARPDSERDRDFAAAWALWTAGRHEDAIAAFKRLVAELRGMSTKVAPVTVQTGVVELAVRADGTRAVAIAGGGAYWFDSAGAPLRYDPAPDASTAVFLPNSPLVVLGGYTTQADTLTIVDSSTFAPALEVPHGRGEVSYGFSASGKTLVYEDHPSDGPPKLHTWDVTTRTERRVFTLREEDECTDLAISPDDQVVSCSYEMSQRLALFFPNAARLDFPGTPEPRVPAYANHGAWIAYGYPTFDDKTGISGKTHLINRATHKFRTSRAIDYPTAMKFSNNDRFLIAGGLRRVSILDVPSLRVRATTPTLPIGIDDQQDIATIEIIGNDAGFWAQMADGTSGVFRLPSGTAVWTGHGDCTVTASGAECVSDYPTPQAVTIDLKLHVTQRKPPAESGEPPIDPMLARMSTLLDGTVCTLSVGSKRYGVFPIAACR